MKRFAMSFLWLALLVIFVLTQPQSLAQEPHPLPPPDNRGGQQSDPKDQPPQESKQPDAEKVTTDSITGTIAKVGNRFVLHVADETNYQLDDQKKAKPFEGKRVKVFGTLDRATNLIRVTSIQPAS
jgi:hypothetical protein